VKIRKRVRRARKSWHRMNGRERALFCACIAVILIAAVLTIAVLVSNPGGVRYR
jgi:hypothetical protein